MRTKLRQHYVQLTCPVSARAKTRQGSEGIPESKASARWFVRAAGDWGRAALAAEGVNFTIMARGKDAVETATDAIRHAGGIEVTKLPQRWLPKLPGKRPGIVITGQNSVLDSGSCPGTL